MSLGKFLQKAWPLFLAVFLLFLGYRREFSDARVLSCHDGDTCLMEKKGGEVIKVRFYGIDAPELGIKAQAFGKEAKDFLDHTILGEWVELEEKGRDPYERILAEVIKDGTSINLRLVELGLAHSYQSWRDGDLPLSTYREAELKAQKLKRGIWSQRQITLPSEFRKNFPRQRKAKTTRESKSHTGLDSY